MPTKYSNPCIRCGKERILSRVYEEEIGNSSVTTTLMVCPDAECQKKVELENKKREEKNAEFKIRSEQRAMARKAARDAEKEHAKR